MRQLAMFLGTIGTTVLLLLTVSVQAAPRCRSLDAWLPGDVIGYLKVHDLGKQLDALLDSKLRRLTVTTSRSPSRSMSPTSE